MPTTLIRRATCVMPAETRVADVLIEDGQIAAIDAPASLAADADEIIDATGLHLLPGVVDSHVHFREPGLTHKEDLASGSRAAAAGGVTTFFDMPNVVPATTTVEQLHARLDLAAATSCVNYGFYIAATASNVEELAAARRTPGIKIFIGSSTGDLLVDGQADLERIFAETELPICAHCEDETTVRANAAALGGGQTAADHSRIRDERAAVIAVRRAMDLARRHHHRFHVLHVSTGAECELIRHHDHLITGEACPHHLLLDTRSYAALDTRAQVNPALKSPEDAAALWDALDAGVLQAVVTDHAPHGLDEKALGYPKSPSGLPAIENSLLLMLDQVHRGQCSLEQVVHWMCAAPARIWDAASKGAIAEEMDADLVLVDLSGEHEIRNDRQHTRCGWSPWDGTTVHARIVRTIVMGRTVYHEGTFDDSVRGEEVQFEHERGGFWGPGAGRDLAGN
ncbi:MAG: dihydroorotase [Phycisphaerales bacterium]